MPRELAHRARVVTELLRSFETYFAEHRECDGLVGSIAEVTQNELPWGVAWIECVECGVRWEQRRAVDAGG
ncbi:MAG: hypothetical protein DMD96_22595 [Candidatus Rokuibacteriota bacterium]|nr:MAG: hypothetical protein DMD96_22595 [Candidatus Rokubacteria bacterium]